MEKNINREKNGTVQVVLEYTPEEVNEIQKNTFNKVRRNLRVNGFRKGKISYKMAQKLFGGNFLDDEIINSTINEEIKKTLDEGPTPLTQPILGKFEYTDDNGLIANINFAVLPEINIPNERITSPNENIIDLSDEVLSEDLNNESLITLADYLVKTPVDREIQENDLVELDVIDTNARKAIPKEVSFIIGKDNLYIDTDLTKELIGKKKGKLARVKNGNLYYDFKIKDIYEYELPEFTEEFVKDNFDFDTVDEFKDFLDEVNKSSKFIRLSNKNGEILLKDVVDNTDIEISPLYIEKLKNDYKDYLDDLAKLDSVFSKEASIDENLENFAKDFLILNDLVTTHNIELDKLREFVVFNAGTQYDDFLTGKKKNELKDTLLTMSFYENEIGSLFNVLNNMFNMTEKEKDA